MSKLNKKIDTITNAQISSTGVTSLAVRPNQRSSGSQYGEGGLSARELQDRFDRLACLAIDRCNMLTQLLSGEYIPNIQNNEKESILEYILVVKAEDSGLSADMSLADVFAEILTTDGQLKAIDPTADDGAFAELNTVIAKLYEKLSDNSESVTSIEHTIADKLPVKMVIEESNGLHRFVFINKKYQEIGGSEFYIDLFSHHNEDDNAHDNKFSSIETTVEANKQALQKQVDDVEVDVEAISRDLGEFKSSVNTLLNSDDTTLDQTKEIVAYIKNNKNLIDAITTSKVNVSDIADNLDTNDPKKVLSAAQGVALKQSKVNVSDIADNLDTDNPNKVLSAAQGVELKRMIGDIALVTPTSNLGDGDGTASIQQLNASAAGENSSAFGADTLSSGDCSHAEGYKTIASGLYSHAEGGDAEDGIRFTTASGDRSHAEGKATYATGEDSHSEGAFTKAQGKRSHAEGNETKALGIGTHSEGVWTVAYGADGSHAEGYKTTALGVNSHAEGMSGSSSDPQVYNDGLITDRTKSVEEVAALHNGTRDTGKKLDGKYFTLAYDIGAHAEGRSTVACGKHSHSEGQITFAGGENSHTEGYATVAYGKNQHVQGSCNVLDKSGNYAHILGNGKYNGTTKKFERSNAHTVDWYGNAWFSGDVRVGGDDYDDGTSLGDLAIAPMRVDVNLTLEGGEIEAGKLLKIAFSYHSVKAHNTNRTTMGTLVNDIRTSYKDYYLLPVTVCEYNAESPTSTIRTYSGVLYTCLIDTHFALNLDYTQVGALDLSLSASTVNLISMDLNKEYATPLSYTINAHVNIAYGNTN